MSGSSTGGSSAQSGVYGTLGTPSVGNMPGGRDGAVGWTDKNGNLWLFGGYGYDANGNFRVSERPLGVQSFYDRMDLDGRKQLIGLRGFVLCHVGNVRHFGYACRRKYARRTQAATWTDSGGNFWLLGGFVDPVNGDNWRI